MPDPALHRYHRQILLPHIGEDGQRALLRSHALIVGCGALGAVVADQLTRAGVGTLTLIDRDTVELTNLQRQVLFDEADARERLPKAEAARRKLQRTNAGVRIIPLIADFDRRSAPSLIAPEPGATNPPPDIIIDATDNIHTRALINDLAVRHAIPFIYAGAVATRALTMTILPRRATQSPEPPWGDAGATPCLRCIFPDLPTAAARETCDTAGVLGPITALAASIQSAEAIKVLLRAWNDINRALLSIDLWPTDFRAIDIARAGLPTPENPKPCPCCIDRRFDALSGDEAASATSLCGRDAVQITPPVHSSPAPINLAALAARLAPHGDFAATPFLVRGVLAHEPADPELIRPERASPSPAAIELTIFADGRAIVRGTTRPERARAIYARYIGA